MNQPFAMRVVLASQMAATRASRGQKASPPLKIIAADGAAVKPVLTTNACERVS